MKIILESNEQEKKEILEQHNLFKEVLQSKVTTLMVNEQTSTLKGVEFLKTARDKGCKIAVGSVIKSAPGKPSVLFKVADYDSTNGYFKKGDELYIKDDYTFDVVTTDSTGKKTKSASNKKWACPAMTVVARTSNDRKLEDYTPEQQALVNKYKKLGYKLKSEIDLDQIGSWEQFTLNFPDGSGSVVLYKDPSFVSKVEVGSEPSAEKQGALISGEKRAKVCREKIKDFADSANKKLKLPMSQINADKTFVMACRDQFGMKYNDLGVTKKNLEYLTGQRDGLDGYKLKVGSPYRL